MNLSIFIRLYDEITLLFFIILWTFNSKDIDLSGYIFICFLSFFTIFINLKPKNKNPTSVQFIDILNLLSNNLM